MDRQPDKQTDRQTHRRTGRQTDRQIQPTSKQTGDQSQYKGQKSDILKLQELAVLFRAGLEGASQQVNIQAGIFLLSLGLTSICGSHCSSIVACLMQLFSLCSELVAPATATVIMQTMFNSCLKLVLQQAALAPAFLLAMSWCIARAYKLLLHVQSTDRAT